MTGPWKHVCQQCGRRSQYLWRVGNERACRRCAKAAGLVVVLPYAVKKLKSKCFRCEKKALRLMQCLPGQGWGTKLLCRPCVLSLGLKAKERKTVRPCRGMEGA